MKGVSFRVVEGAIIVLGLLSFWPLTLGYNSLAYQCGLVVMLVLLAVLAVVRFRRVRDAFDRESASRSEDAPSAERRP